MRVRKWSQKNIRSGMTIHGAIGRNWKLLEDGISYWEYEPEKIIRNNQVEILWDRTAHTYKTVRHDRPNRENCIPGRYCIAIPNQNNMMKPAQRKINKYRNRETMEDENCRDYN